MSTPATLSPLQHWMRLASVQEQEHLVLQLGSSREYLYQLGSGTRRASSDFASRLERAVDSINTESVRADILPRVPRTSLADACAACEYAQKCLGDISAPFDVVDTEGVPGRSKSAGV